MPTSIAPNDSTSVNPQSAIRNRRSFGPQSEIRNPQSIILLVAALLLLSACQGEAPKIEPIAYGTATCARCSSVISDPSFAAQSRYSGGRVKVFDDPGCLVKSLADESEQPNHMFFRDYAAEKWLQSGEVWFASTAKTVSPQKYGWAAFSDFAAAQDAVGIAGGGEILQFEQLKQRLSK
jgi:hypothetical protein